MFCKERSHSRKKSSPWNKKWVLCFSRLTKYKEKRHHETNSFKYLPVFAFTSLAVFPPRFFGGFYGPGVVDFFTQSVFYQDRYKKRYRRLCRMLQ